MKDHGFEQYNKADRLKRSDQDAYDHQNEVAKRDTGRLKKFMVNGDAPTVQKQKKEGEKRFVLSALAALLNDPEYAALYNETKGLVAKAMGITEEELDRAHQELGTLTDQRNNMRGDANRLADGRIVFKDKNGNVVTEDDEVITDQVLLDSIVWKNDAPTYEEFVANRDAIHATREKIDILTRYQTDVLGAAKVRLEDEDNPPSKEELEEIKRDVYEQAPAQIQDRLDAKKVSNHTQNMSHEIAAFKM